VQQEVLSPPESFSFFFPLYLVRLPASLGTPCSFLTKDKDKELMLRSRQILVGRSRRDRRRLPRGARGVLGETALPKLAAA
jgi:hypothetical protein